MSAIEVKIKIEKLPILELKALRHEAMKQRKPIDLILHENTKEFIKDLVSNTNTQREDQT